MIFDPPTHPTQRNQAAFCFGELLEERERLEAAADETRERETRETKERERGRKGGKEHGVTSLN